MELSPNFTDTELKAKYLELVKKYHPDLSQDPNAAASFRQIQEAYSVLSDVQSRNSYQLAMEPILKGDLTEESLRCAANIRKCFY